MNKCGFLLNYVSIDTKPTYRHFIDTCMLFSLPKSNTKSTFRILGGTTIKLNGTNYLLWAKPFTVFLGTHRKIKHIIDDLSSPKDPYYDDWFTIDCSVISWLVNSMESIIASDVMFLTLAKKTWETLKETYSPEKISLEFLRFMNGSFLFSKENVQEPYTSLRVLMDELEVHQPIIFDAKILKEYCDGLGVAKLLSHFVQTLHLSWCRYSSVSTLHICSCITYAYRHPQLCFRSVSHGCFH